MGSLWVGAIDATPWAGHMGSGEAASCGVSSPEHSGASSQVGGGLPRPAFSSCLKGHVWFLRPVFSLE